MADAAALGLSEDRVTWSDLRRYRRRKHARRALVLACVLLLAVGGVVIWQGSKVQSPGHMAKSESNAGGLRSSALTKSAAPVAQGKKARNGSLCEVFKEWQTNGKFGGILRRGAGLSARCEPQSVKKSAASKKRG